MMKIKATARTDGRRQVGMLIVPAAMYVAVTPKLGVSTFAEFAALTKSKPEQIAVGTNGAGTLPHYAGLLLRKKGGIPVNVVPYNQGGSMAAIADIMGGRVHATIEAVFGLRGPLQSGDLRLVGVMSSERDPQFPDVPAITETLPGLTAVSFVSLAVPAATPEGYRRPPQRSASPGAGNAKRQTALRRPRRVDASDDTRANHGLHRERAEDPVAR